jgi:hypothetical protein
MGSDTYHGVAFNPDLESPSMKATRVFRLALLCGASLAILSCSDHSPASVTGTGATPAPEASLVGSLVQNLHLLDCSPLPYDSVTQTIGPEGGLLRVGPHSLLVPPGALDYRVSITAVAPSGNVRFVRFQPEGLQFEQPAALTLDYHNCSLVGTLLPKKVAYVNDAFQILETLLSLDNFFSQTVTGQLKHFSGYLVAY